MKDSKDKCLEQVKKCKVSITENEEKCKTAAGKCAEDVTTATEKCKTDGEECKTKQKSLEGEVETCDEEKKACLWGRTSLKLNICKRNKDKCVGDTSAAKLKAIKDEAFGKQCAKNLETTNNESKTLRLGGDICPAKLEDFQSSMTKAASKYETVQKSFDLILDQMKST